MTDILDVDGRPTGNIYIDTLISGAAWAQQGNEPAFIRFCFQSDPANEFTHTIGEVVAWSEAEKASMRKAQAAWEAVANVKFIEVENQDDADVWYWKDAALRPQGASGWHYMLYPGSGKPLFGAFNCQGGFWQDATEPGGGAFWTFLHELGHGLGLAHPHDGDYDLEPTVFPGVTDMFSPGDGDKNIGLYTVMSYLVSPGEAPGIGFASTPMAFDIAAIQEKYGANMETATGDDTYVLPSENVPGTSWSCIWDAGGIDTVSAGNTSANTTIDLREAVLNGPDAGGYVSRVTDIYGGMTIARGVTIENATGGGGDDLIIGNEAGNVLSGLAGADMLFGGDGADALDGFDGADELDGGDGADRLEGGDDADYLSGGGGDDSLDGGSGDDEIRGDEGNDALTGGAGNDNVGAGDGDDTVDGGSGNDQLYGNDGIDAINAGEGDDYVEAGEGSDTIEGGSGNDQLYGNDGIDSINAGEGDDYVEAGEGNDTIEGSSGNDVLLGDDGDDSISAGLGDDIVGGGAGLNLIDLGDGNDIAAGGNDADRISGGLGDDRLFGDDIFALTSLSQINSPAVTAGGDDTLSGGEGGDQLFGMLGNDRLSGNSGDDMLDSGAGNDTLEGGSGNDTLDGGSGADRFIFAEAAGKANADVITGFNAAEDKIVIDNAFFSKLLDGALAAKNFFIGAHAHDAKDFVIFDQSTGNLWYDMDGRAHNPAQLICTLDLASFSGTLTAGSFEII